MAEELDAGALAEKLAALEGWIHDETAATISRAFKFETFSQAFAFMTQVALAAEKADHHPDWSNSYNRVSITLSTHSAGGLTDKDFSLAAKIDGFARS